MSEELLDPNEELLDPNEELLDPNEELLDPNEEDYEKFKKELFEVCKKFYKQQGFYMEKLVWAFDEAYMTLNNLMES